MTKGFKPFKDALETILAGQVSDDDTKPFAASYGYAAIEFEKWPAVVVHQLENGAENHGFQSNQTLLSMPFVIRAFWQADSTEETENNKLEALDDMLAELRKAENYGNLGGAVDKFDIVSIDPIAVEGDQPMSGWQIIVNGACVFSST